MQKAKIFAAPGRYIQGYEEIDNIAKHISWMGKSFLFIVSKKGLDRVKDKICKSFEGIDCNLHFEIFNGECTWKEIHRITDIARNVKAECVIGAGGGKILDTARAVCKELRTYNVLVPTAASNDASTSSIFATYNEDGSSDATIKSYKNPEVVLVDTKIIAEAPTRLFVAGVGDTLSTYFGARVCVEGYKENFVDGLFTETSYTLAKLSYDTVLKYGYEAKLAIEKNLVTKAVEKVIEASILLSGLGFESNGISADHSIYFGFLDIKNREHMLHGEYVAFSTIAMLVLEGRPPEEIEEIIKFCIKMGLPVTLEELNLGDITDEELEIMAKGAVHPSQFTHNEPFVVTEKDVIAAVLVTDALGKAYKGIN